MPQERTWTIRPGTWHVAKGRDDRWKVLQEGEPTAESRHPTQDDALEAARELAAELPDSVIKVHDEDGSLIDELKLDEL